MKMNSFSRHLMCSTVIKITKTWLIVCNELLTNQRLWDYTYNQLLRQVFTTTLTKIHGNGTLSNTTWQGRVGRLTIKVTVIRISWSVQIPQAKALEPLLREDTLDIWVMWILMFHSIFTNSKDKFKLWTIVETDSPQQTQRCDRNCM